MSEKLNLHPGSVVAGYLTWRQYTEQTVTSLHSVVGKFKSILIKLRLGYSFVHQPYYRKAVFMIQSIEQSILSQR